MLQAEESSIDLPWEKGTLDCPVKSESMVVERDEEGRVEWASMPQDLGDQVISDPGTSLSEWTG
jgi:hypothetical protein